MRLATSVLAAMIMSIPVMAQEPSCYTLVDFFQFSYERSGFSPVPVSKKAIAPFVKLYNSIPLKETKLFGIDEIYAVEMPNKNVTVLYFKEGCALDFLVMPIDFYNQTIDSVHASYL